MHRVSNGSQVAALPAAEAVTGAPGYFTSGTPGVLAPTDVDKTWMNAVQEEIAHVVESAGIALDKTVNTQLQAAIAELIAAAVAAEAAVRATADTTLNTEIVAEQNARAAADTSIYNSIITEQGTRAAGDTTLTNAIASEAADRASQDAAIVNALNADVASLTASINSEAGTRASGDAALQGQIDANINQPVKTDSAVHYDSVTTSETISAGGNITTSAQLFASDGTVHTSDVRLKEDIEPVESALDIIRRLNTYWYRLRKDPTRRHVGFLYHEVDETLPELAHVNPETGFGGVNYAQHVAVLNLGIKEVESLARLQASMIAVQDVAIIALTARVAALEARG